ncbi:hypothetical protein V8C86DRAFT_2685749 [Haematococcus lacustris]
MTATGPAPLAHRTPHTMTPQGAGAAPTAKPAAPPQLLQRLSPSGDWWKRGGAAGPPQLPSVPSPMPPPPPCPTCAPGARPCPNPVPRCSTQVQQGWPQPPSQTSASLRPTCLPLGQGTGGLRPPSRVGRPGRWRASRRRPTPLAVCGAGAGWVVAPPRRLLQTRIACCSHVEGQALLTARCWAPPHCQPCHSGSRHLHRRRSSWDLCVVTCRQARTLRPQQLLPPSPARGLHTRPQLTSSSRTSQAPCPVCTPSPLCSSSLKTTCLTGWLAAWGPSTTCSSPRSWPPRPL